LIPSQATHSGQYLSTNGTSLSWQSIATSLSALSDVNVTSVADGQVLKYNQSQGKWIPAADLTTSGGGGVALTSFSVTTASASGSGGLSYDNTTGVFVFTPPSITTYTLPTATTGVLGGVRVDGTSITINSGVISSAGVSSVVGSGYISVNTASGVATVSTTLTRFRSLDDSTNVVVNGNSLTIDKVAIHAVATYDVLAVNPIAYTFLNFFSTQNPTIYALSGTTIAFNLQVPGHPTVLQTTGGVDLVWTTVNTYGTLIHVSESGVVSTGANAMGQVTGTLYWNINPSFSGTVRYQCTLHPLMRGNIVVKSIVSLA
jgi:plastocyanin